MSAMLHPRPTRKYHCRQAELYTIVQVGWTSYLQHLPQFSAFSDRYDADLYTTRMASLEAARNLPDKDTRADAHKSLRIRLDQLAVTCLIQWMNMSSYIRDGFPPDMYQTKRLAAGHSYYASALNRDWEQVNTLMNSGQLFLDDNTAELSAGGMPVSFPLSFSDARTNFMDTYNEFQQAIEQSTILTDQRVIANNIIYDDLMAMFTDGNRIFRNNAAVRLQFNFSRLQGLISGYRYAANAAARTAVISGIVADADTLSPIAGAILVITFNGQEYQAQSDADGQYRIIVRGINDALTVLLQVTHPLYAEQQLAVILMPDKVLEQQFQLTPIAPPLP